MTKKKQWTPLLRIIILMMTVSGWFPPSSFANTETEPFNDLRSRKLRDILINDDDDTNMSSGSYSGEENNSTNDLQQFAIPTDSPIDSFTGQTYSYANKIREMLMLTNDSKKVANILISEYDKKFQLAINQTLDWTGIEKYFSKQMRSMEGLGFSILNSNLDVDMTAFNYETLKMEVRRNVTAGINAVFPTNTSNDECSIRLPDAFLANLNSGKNLISAVFVLYRSLSEQLINSFSKQANTTVNSHVIGASLTISGKKTYLDGHYVVIRLPHIQKVNGSFVTTCVYWDFDNVTWETTGCIKGTESNSEVTVCFCDHLTNFAVLMQPYYSDELSQDAVLNWITIIGSSISVVSLILSLICFCTVRSLQGILNTIHINLSLSLLIADTTILVSVFYEKSETVLGIPCVVMAILLHYFYLASFMWMGIEGFHIYRSLVVIVYKHKARVIVYHVIGYGIPGIIVSLCVTLNYTYFNAGTIYGSSKSCWIAESSGFVWTFLAFVILILLFNSVVIFLATKAVATTLRNRPSLIMTKNARHSREWLWHLVILHPLLGLAWLLGFFQFNQFKIISYMFAVCVSLQGFFIFLLHCIRNIYVQKYFAINMFRKNEALTRSTHSQSISAYESSNKPVLASSVTPAATANEDVISVEEWELIPKKRPSIKGWRYSWEVRSQLQDVSHDHDRSNRRSYEATFKPGE